MRQFFYLLCLLLSHAVSAQNTVGLLSLDAAASVDGYNLIYPERQSTVYLLDQCGQVVHQWDDEDAANPGSVAYILPDGRLLRAKSFGPLFDSPSFGAGGSGGVIQLLNWDNQLEWTYVVADSTERQHHDVHYMPNGHELILAYERFELEDLLLAGFDTISNSQRRIWSEKLIEVDPQTDSIVWEWHVWDHLVQEYNPTVENYGVISESAHRIDLNYHEFSFTRDDWIHANAIDYNEELDQIMISARNFNEAWIIDHSTTSAEAATSSGGNSGRGGDLIWRWGSPHAYAQDSLSAEKLFWNHDTHWIDDFVDEDYEHYGAVAVFNNFLNFELEDGRSTGHVISPEWDASTQRYLQVDSVFLPQDFSETFSHPTPEANFSTAASSIQIIDDGNVIMCAARQGRSFELDETGALVWEYLTPFRNGVPIAQGSTLNISDNFTFNVRRYPPDYSGFAGRDLTPQGYLELEPNEAFCASVPTDEPLDEAAELALYPNPASTQVQLRVPNFTKSQPLMVYNSQGQLVTQLSLSAASMQMNIVDWPAGLYWVVLPEQATVSRLVVE